MVSLVIAIAAALLIVDTRVRTSLAAYMVLTAATLWLIYPESSRTPYGLAIFIALASIKIVAGPAAVLYLMKRVRLRDDLVASIALPGRIAVAFGVVLLGRAAGTMQAFAGIPLAGIVFYCIFASVFVVILHRSLLSHVIGLLALGSAITLGGAVFAPGLPGAIELADTFDAVIATFVAISVARALVRHDPDLDVRSLRGLRG